MVASEKDGYSAIDSVLGSADDELKNKLKRRHFISEGVGNQHCWVRPGRNERAAELEDDADHCPKIPGEPSDRTETSPVSRHATDDSHPEEPKIVPCEAVEQPGNLEKTYRQEDTPDHGAGPGLLQPPAPAFSGGVRGITVSTPPHPSPAVSPEPTPRGMNIQNGAGRTRIRGDDANGALGGSPKGDYVHTGDTADKLEFEWQFEIMNNLPRERAIALVHYLRDVEHQRNEAILGAKQLQQKNRDLQRRLRETGVNPGGVHPGGVHPGGAKTLTGRCCSPPFLFAMFVFPVLLALGAPYLAAIGVGTPNIVDSVPDTWSDVYDGVRGTVLSWAGCPINNRETTVREMTLRETTTKEPVDKFRQECDRLKEEHGLMHVQLQRLHADIDDAVHRGQDTVCWKV